MKHRWAKLKWRQYGIRPHDPKPVRMPHLASCVQCGAKRYLKSGVHSGWRTFPTLCFAAYGDIYRDVVHMPPCEGLPANYDAPIGA